MKYMSLFSIGLCCLLAGCQYGAREDHSRFKSAVLAQNGRIVVFTFHDFFYRPAQGLAAFPDGGIPKYIRDRSFLCTFDRTNNTLKKIMVAKNDKWSDGQGVLHIVTSCGDMILASQAGQTRNNLSTSSMQHHLAHITTGVHQTFDLTDDLRKHGRVPGPLYLVDEQGTLVMITQSSNNQKTPAKSSEEEIPEIWVRHADGRYIRAAVSAHYEETANNEVIYWNPGDRKFYGFNIIAGTTRILENSYKGHAFEDVTQGVNVGTLGTSIEFGLRIGDAWQYTPLPITAAAIMDL